MNYDKSPKGFGPTVISHEENPKNKFLKDAIQKYGDKQKKPDPGYRVTVTETKIEHE